MNKWGIDIFVFGGENAFSPTPVNPVICGLYCLIFIFSTMFQIHINGRSSSHNSSQELDELGTSYDTSSSLMVTGRSTIAIITPTNTMYSEYSFCGIVLLIICGWFALVMMIAIREDRYKSPRKSFFHHCRFKCA